MMIESNSKYTKSYNKFLPYAKPDPAIILDVSSA